MYMTDRELLEELLNIQKEMMSNQKEMMGRQESMEKDISSIKIALENDIYPSIKMLFELQLENSKAFDQTGKRCAEYYG